MRKCPDLSYRAPRASARKGAEKAVIQLTGSELNVRSQGKQQPVLSRSRVELMKNRRLHPLLRAGVRRCRRRPAKPRNLIRIHRRDGGRGWVAVAVARRGRGHRHQVARGWGGADLTRASCWPPPAEREAAASGPCLGVGGTG